jgi:Mg-chelatase subunit ChlD
MQAGNNSLEISVLKGDKLFNQNTPFIININSPQPKEGEKKCNADLICVIDISYSMEGFKLELVKKSLKILTKMMDENDRLALVLFENKASIYFDLDYMTEKNKQNLINKISEIKAHGCTEILSGLEKAIEILKNEQLKTKKNNNNRVSSIILLSDGCDNNKNDIQLGEALKNLTKGKNLSFTLNTFGYGSDHDPKIMNRLANIRDGSFFYVEDYKKVSEYFVTVLGGVVSVISKNVKINVKLLNPSCEIIKIFGEDNLFSHNLLSHIFKTEFLQLVCGKEYTFVLEIKIDEKKVKIGDELLYVEVFYKDINLNDKLVKKTYMYKYELTDVKVEKANEEYIRSQVYYILDEALKLREKNRTKDAKDLLNKMEEWLKKNYKGDNKSYLEDIEKSKSLFNDDYTFKNKGIAFAKSNIREKICKRDGMNNMYMNCNQEYYCRNAENFDDDINQENIDSDYNYNNMNNEEILIPESYNEYDYANYNNNIDI